MKRIYFILVLSLAFLKGYSNNVDGYIVTLNNDTVQVQIKLSGGFFFGIGSYNMYKQVQTVDSGGTIKVLTPKEIKAYGYTHKSKDYVYRVKKIKDGSYYFLEPVRIGNKTSLYKYTVTRPNGQPHGSIDEEFYTFEKSDGNYLFLKSFDALETLRAALKSFYNDNSDVQQLIDTKFSARRKIQKDIQDIVDAINKS